MVVTAREFTFQQFPFATEEQRICPMGATLNSSDPFERKACLQFQMKVPLDFSGDFSFFRIVHLLSPGGIFYRGSYDPGKSSRKVDLVNNFP